MNIQSVAIYEKIRTKYVTKFYHLITHIQSLISHVYQAIDNSSNSILQTNPRMKISIRFLIILLQGICVLCSFAYYSTVFCTFDLINYRIEIIVTSRVVH